MVRMVNIYAYSYCNKNFILLTPPGVVCPNLTNPENGQGVVCPNLTNPENGQVVQALDGNIPGTVANYSCNAGYTLFGNVSRECISTGVQVLWTGEAPTCQQRKPVKIHAISIHIPYSGKFLRVQNAVSALE